MVIFTIAFNYHRLYAHGGGDSAELSMRGIQLAVENSHPGSSIFVITDADAKDIELQVRAYFIKFKIYSSGDKLPVSLYIDYNNRVVNRVTVSENCNSLLPRYGTRSLFVFH